MIRVANAPVSYGAFELTVGLLPNVPGPDEVLDAIAAAGYAGTELGPLGYLGSGEVLRARLSHRRLTLAGGFVELRLGTGDLAPLEEALAVLAGHDAKPVLADAGPRAGSVDWARLCEDIAGAAELARSSGFAPTFHHHMGTRVQSPAEIERVLEATDVGLLLDTGHLTAAGGDPAAAVRSWRERIDHVHVKDVRLSVIRAAADWPEAWRGGAFCELGTGDAELDGFFGELGGYSGWLVVEQDWVPRPGESVSGHVEAQARNRVWLEQRFGI